MAPAKRSELFLVVAVVVVVTLLLAVLTRVKAQGDHQSTTTANKEAQQQQKPPPIPPLLTSSPLDDMSSMVKVFDDVLNVETAEWLHHHAVQEKERSERDGQLLQFAFPLVERHNHAPLQQLINEILLQMFPQAASSAAATASGAGAGAGTASQPQPPMYYVEFWTRSIWKHVFAHQDMDEGWEKELRRQQQQQQGATSGQEYRLKHPERGYVLYLRKGKSVQGPTLVFNATNGGSQLAQQDETTLISVPVVPGRLLRFQGNLLHAVPRPYHVYWTLQQEVPPRIEPTSEWERSVVLFNLWPAHQGMLSDKTLDVGMINATTSATTTTGGPIEQHCNPSSSWKEVDVVPYQRLQSSSSSSLSSSLWSWWIGPAKTRFQVPLMGGVQRRGTDKYVIRMEAEEDVLDRMFQYPNQVSSVQVEPEKRRSVMGMEF